MGKEGADMVYAQLLWRKTGREFYTSCLMVKNRKEQEYEQ